MAISKVMFSSDNQRWRTPLIVGDFCRRVFRGRIDLDPCSPMEGPNPHLDPEHSYTAGDNGLAKSWAIRKDRPTRTFCNSEYGDALPLWTKRCRRFGASREFGGTRACEIIALWPARPDTGWYSEDVTTADAILHWATRLVFEGAPAGAPFPSVLPYWGPDPVHFMEEGIRHGTVTITRGPNAGLYRYRPRRVGT